MCVFKKIIIKSTQKHKPRARARARARAIIINISCVAIVVMVVQLSFGFIRLRQCLSFLDCNYDEIRAKDKVAKPMQNN